MAREEFLKTLQRELAADDADSENLRHRYERRILAMYRNFAGQLANAIKEPGVYRGERVQIERVITIIDNLTPMLRAGGFNDFIVDYMQDLTELGNKALNYFRHFVSLDDLIGLTDEDKAVMRSLARGYRKAIGRQVDQGLISPIEQALNSGAAGGLSREQMIDSLLTTAGGLTPFRLITLTTDSQRNFHQAVRIAQAEVLDMKIVLYQGPLDSITSAQCEFLRTQGRHGIPNGWLKTEVTASRHNDLRGDPLIERGHPNCRHNWWPVTNEVAEGLGWHG